MSRSALCRVALQVASGLFVPVGAALVLGLGLGCGEAAEVEGGLPLVTIAECEDMGGAPLFDPDDERPVELSCPDGLEAIAEFEEDFYGSEGGVCCTGDDAATDDAASDAVTNDAVTNDEPAGDEATDDSDSDAPGSDAPDADDAVAEPAADDVTVDDTSAEGPASGED